MSANVAAVTPPPAAKSGLSKREGVLARLARDRVALVAAIVLTAIVLAAIGAPLLAPYDPYFTDLSIAMQPPSAEPTRMTWPKRNVRNTEMVEMQLSVR